MPRALPVIAAAALWVAAASAAAQSPAQSYAALVAAITPGVVNISVLLPDRETPLSEPGLRPRKPAPRGGDGEARAAGSGVIVDAKAGLVLTNHHVIQSATKVVVVLKDRREFEARVVGSDAGTDIALLRIEPDNLTAVPIGNSDSVQVGDIVLAIGNPFGIGQTVTAGIVSALGRGGISPEGYEDYIQTDAAINPGNSGGALTNLKGELIGINTAIITAGARDGERAGNIGIGFAVPTNMARAVLAQLQKFGEVRRGRIGIQGRDVTPRLMREKSLGVSEGALVESVDKGSPAETGGVRAGDVVTAINARPVRGVADMRNQVALIPVGEQLEIGYWRGGSTRQTRIAVAPVAPIATAGAPGAAPGPAKPRPPLAALPGAQLADTNDGVVVAAVDPRSRAHELGLRANDIVDYVDRRPVMTVAEVAAVLGTPGRHVLGIVRGDSKIQITVQ